MKLSVIIPAYNAALVIQNTIESLLAQSDPIYEIIIIDDGSVDNTEEVIEKYKNSGPIVYRKQKNAGVSAARNNGVKISTGDWIAFCDADDVWHKDKVKIAKEIIQSNDFIQFIFHDFNIIKGNRIISLKGTHDKQTIFPVIAKRKLQIQQIAKYNKSHDISEYELEWEQVNIFWGNFFQNLIYGNFILPSSVLIKKQTFLDSSGFDVSFRSAEETEYFLRISKTIDFVFIDLPLAGYKKSENSLTSNTIPLLQNGINAVNKNIIQDKENYRRYKKTINKAMSDRYANLSYAYLSELNKKNAIDTGLQSINKNIFEVKAWYSIILSLFPNFVLQLMRILKSKMLSSKV